VFFIELEDFDCRRREFLKMRITLLLIAMQIISGVPLSPEVLSEVFARNFDVYTDILNAKLQLFQRNIEGE
jgi:hypothetical protein